MYSRYFSFHNYHNRSLFTITITKLNIKSPELGHLSPSFHRIKLPKSFPLKNHLLHSLLTASKNLIAL